MRFIPLAAVMISVGVAAGCNNAKSPDTVASDVSSAEQKAAKEETNSENSAASDIGKAAGKVDDKLTDLNNAAAKDSYNLALANADGDRKIALAKCESLAGDAQKQCKKQADADYDAAKANAKAVSVANKQ